jgi:hypothetical protein
MILYINSNDVKNVFEMSHEHRFWVKLSNFIAKNSDVKKFFLFIVKAILNNSIFGNDTKCFLTRCKKNNIEPTWRVSIRNIFESGSSQIICPN